MSDKLYLLLQISWWSEVRRRGSGLFITSCDFSLFFYASSSLPLIHTHTCTQPYLCYTNSFPLNYTTYTHRRVHAQTDTVQSSTPHAASNFLKAINPGVKKYSISTASCCVQSPGPGSAMPYHNQFHKLNGGGRCCMKVRQPTLTAI